MKQKIKNIILRLSPHLPSPVKKLCNLIAIENMRGAVVCPTSIADMEWSLRNLKRAGFQPRRIVDIGAYRGEWSRTASAIFTDSQFFMIEAQENMRAHLDQLVQENPARFSFCIALLAAEKDQILDFYEMASGSSVYPEISDVPRTKRALRTRTLDEVLEAARFGRPDFMKLDVQGFELEVLKGAAQSLQHCEGLLVEVSLLPYNEGAPDMFEVMTFLEQRGFCVYDICSLIRRPGDGALFQTDLLFLRRDSRLRTSAG